MAILISTTGTDYTLGSTDTDNVFYGRSDTAEALTYSGTGSLKVMDVSNGERINLDVASAGWQIKVLGNTVILSSGDRMIELGAFVAGESAVVGFSGGQSISISAATVSNSTVYTATPSVGSAVILSNAQQVAFAAVLDTIAPTLSMTSDKTALKAGETATLSFTLSEASTNFSVGDIDVTGGSLSGFSGSGTSYSATFTPTPSSSVSAAISVASGKFSDAASNLNVDGADANNAVSISIDTIAPTIAISSSRSALHGGQAATLTFKLSEASTNFSAGDITVTGGSISGFTGSGTNYTAIFTPAASSTSNGVVSVALGGFTDAAGNLNAAASNTVTMSVDTVKPTVTSISFSDSALRIGDTALVTIDFSEAVTGLVLGDFNVPNGELTELATANGGLTWTATFTPTANIESTTNVVTLASAALTDLAGNTSNVTLSSANLTVDTIAPVAPGIALASDSGSSAVDGISNVGIINVTGLEAGASWEYSTDAGATFTSGSEASFTLAAGTHAIGSVLVGQTDAAGNVSVVASNSSAITIDTTKPTVTSFMIADTALKMGDTSLVTITFSEAVSGLTLGDFSVPNGGLTGLSTADAGVTWTATFTPAADIDNTNNVITLASAAVKDVAGNANEAAVNSVSYAIHTLAPIATLTQAVFNDAGAASVQSSAIGTAYLVSDSVVVSNEASIISAANTNWTSAIITAANSATSLPATGLADGTYHVYVVDAAGNLSAASAASVVVDSTAIAAPVINTIASDNVINASEQHAGLTISGTAEANSSVRITWGGVTRTAQVDANGDWSRFYADTAMPSTTDTVSVIAVDAAGNMSTASAVTLNMDIAVPVAPTINALAGNDVVSTAEVSGLTISGKGEAGAIVSLSFTSGHTLAAANTVVVDSNGDWSIPVSSDDVIAFGQGSETVTAIQRDDAGNVSAASTSSTFVIDTVAPVAPVMTLHTDSGSSASDGVTNVGTIDVTGLEAGASWAYSTDAGDNFTTGTGTSFVLAAGSHAIGSIKVRQTDAAGNTGTLVADTSIITVDTVKPTVTSISFSDTALQMGDTALVTIEFSEAVNGLVVGDFNVQNGALTGLTTANEGLSWTATFTPTVNVESTTNVITLASAAVMDVAGNTNAAAVNSVNYAIDTLAPIATLTQAVFNDAGTASVQSSAIGTAYLVSDTVVVSNAASITGAADANWNSVAITAANSATSRPATGLADGTYHVYVVDAAGNLSAASAASVVVDSTAIAAPVINTIASDNKINAGEKHAGLTISGTAEANSSVRITWGGLTRTVKVDADGDWSRFYADTAMPSTTDTVSVIAVDAAGNMSTASTAIVVVDIIVPTVAAQMATVVHNTNNDATLDTNETITISFSEVINVDKLVLGSSFAPGALNGSDVAKLGTGYSVAAVSAVDGYASAFTITLGTTPSLLPGAVLTFAAASIADGVANSAASNLAFTVPTDIISAVAVAIERVSQDVASTASYAANDTLCLTFSEPVEVSKIAVSTLMLDHGHSLGNSLLSAINSVNGYASQFNVSIGSSSTLSANDTITIAGADIVDRAGNVAATDQNFVAPASLTLKLAALTANISALTLNAAVGTIDANGTAVTINAAQSSLTFADTSSGTSAIAITVSDAISVAQAQTLIAKTSLPVSYTTGLSDGLANFYQPAIFIFPAMPTAAFVAVCNDNASVKVNVNGMQNGTGGIDALNAIAALTTGAVTASVTHTDAAYVATLESGNHWSITVTGTATAADLNTINGLTNVVVDASGITAISGAFAAVQTLLAARTATEITLASDFDLVISDAISVASANTLDSANGAAGIAATISAAAVAVLNTLTGVHAYSVSVNDGSVDAAALTTLDGKTSVNVNANAVATLTGTAAHIAAAISAATIDTAVNVGVSVDAGAAAALDLNTIEVNTTAVVNATAVSALTGSAADFATLVTAATNLSPGISLSTTFTATVADAISVSAVNALANLSTGVITATIVDTAIADLAALADTQVNAYTITVADTTVAAATLNTLDGKTSIVIDATAVTSMSGNAAALIDATDNALTLTLALSTSLALSASGTTSVADANILAAVTSGVVTATLSDTLAHLSAVTETGNAYTVTVSDTGSVNASELTTLNGKTTQLVTATAAATIAGTDVALITALSHQGEIDTAANVQLNASGTSSVTNVNTLAGLTTGVITATLSDTLADLGALTGVDNAYSITVTDTGSVTADALNTLDGRTSALVTATAATTITGATVALLNATDNQSALMTGASVALTASDVSIVDEANLLDARTTGVVTTTLLDTLAVLNTLTGTNNAYAITVVDTGALSAALLNTLDGKTTALVDASAATAITGSAAAILDATDNALTLLTAANVLFTLAAGSANAANLNTLDSRTTTQVDAAAVTLISGAAAALIDATDNQATLLTASDVALTVIGTATVADANLLAAVTTGVVTATLSDTLVNFAGLNEIDNAYTITVSDTGSLAAADLNALDLTTTELVTATAATTITGTAAELIDATDNALTLVVGANVALTASGTTSVANANTLAAVTGGVVMATLSGTLADLAVITESGNAYTVTVTDIGTVNAVDLNTLNGKTTALVTATAATTISGTASALISALGDQTAIATDANVQVIATGTTTVANANTLDGDTGGVITATLSDTLANLAILTGTGNAYAVTVTDVGTVAAAALNTLDGKTTALVNATAATTITGTTAALIDATNDQFTLDTGASVALTASDSSTVIEANLLDAVTTGVVTARVADTLANLATLTGTNNAYALTVTDTGTLAAADLNALDAITTGLVTATAATTITGTAVALLDVTDDQLTLATAANVALTVDAGIVSAVNLNILDSRTTGLVDASAVTTLIGSALVLIDATNDQAAMLTNASVTLTAIGATSVTQANALAAVSTGVVTATLSDTLVNLAALTETGNAYAVTVTDTGTLTAATLNTLDGKTTALVTATAATTITGTAAEIIEALNDQATIATAANVALHVTGTTSVADANTLAALTTGVVSATLSDTLVNLCTLTETGNAYTITVTDAGAVSAADLNAVDAKTTAPVTTVATLITGTAAEIATAISADGIDTALNLGVTVDGGSAAATDLNTIDSHTSALVNALAVTTITGDVAAVVAAIAAVGINTTSTYNAVMTGTATVSQVTSVDGDTTGIVSIVNLADNYGSILTLANTAASILQNVSGLVTANGNGLVNLIDMTAVGGLHSLIINAGGDNDQVIGSLLGDTINGGTGNDTVAGGDGSDTITLGEGSDVLLFDSLSGADTIADYNVADDTIQLSLVTFSALGATGALSAAQFQSGISAVAATAAVRVVYDSGSHNLYYDADGSGAGAAVLIGNFSNGAALLFSEFVVID